AEHRRFHWLALATGPDGKSTEGMTMNFYKIVFADGSEVQEFADSEADLRDFVARCYCTRTISKIIQL
ncbi:hypothetical protein, partial [Pseudomonas syringae group genomosp. 3]